MDVVFLDFQKGFVKVPRGRLLNKRGARGIRGQVLVWIKDWFTGKWQSGNKKGLFWSMVGD